MSQEPFVSMIVGILFWASIILSLVMSAIGAFRRSWLHIVLAAVAAAPSAWYLSNYPLLRFCAPAIPVFYLAAAVATRGRSRWLPRLLLLPPAANYAWLVVVVVTPYTTAGPGG